MTPKHFRGEHSAAAALKMTLAKKAEKPLGKYYTHESNTENIQNH